MEDRKAFSFYRSYFEAAKDLPTKEDQADFLMAICSYIFDGVEPEIQGVASAMFKLAKPNLEMSVKRANAGQIGGKSNKQKANAKQNESKTEANEEQTESKGEAINDYMINDYIDKEKEKPTKEKDGWEEVFKAYEKRFPSTLSSFKAQQLSDILDNYGKDAVLFAIKEASSRNAKDPVAYIRTVAMNRSRERADPVLPEKDLGEIGRRMTIEAEKRRSEGKSVSAEEMKKQVIEQMKRKGMTIIGNSNPT